MAGFWTGVFDARAGKKAAEVLKNLGKIKNELQGDDRLSGIDNYSEKLKAARESFSEGTINRSGLNNVRREAEAVFSEAKSHLKDAARYARGQKLVGVMTSRPAKIIGAIVAIPALAMAGVAAMAAFAGKRQSKEMESGENLMAQHNASANAELAAMRQQVIGGNTMMGMEPVHGNHAEQVIARRGGISQGADTSIPNLTAF